MEGLYSAGSYKEFEKSLVFKHPGEPAVSYSDYKTRMHKTGGFADLPSFKGVYVNAGFAYSRRFSADFNLF